MYSICTYLYQPNPSSEVWWGLHRHRSQLAVFTLYSLLYCTASLYSLYTVPTRVYVGELKRKTAKTRQNAKAKLSCVL